MTRLLRVPDRKFHFHLQGPAKVSTLVLRASRVFGVFMNEQNTVACWTAARWTIATSLGVVALIWFFGGFETTALAIVSQ